MRAVLLFQQILGSGMLTTVLTLALCTTACQKQDGGKKTLGIPSPETPFGPGTGPSPTPAPSVLYKVQFSGPSSVNAGECQPIAAKALSLATGVETPLTATTRLPLELSGRGSLYDEPTCTRTTTYLEFPTARAAASVYVRSQEPGSHVLRSLTSTEFPETSAFAFSVNPDTQLSFSAAPELSFGVLGVSGTSVQTLTLYNDGVSTAETLNVQSAGLPAPFSLLSTTCGATLKGLSHCLLAIEFKPTAAGDYRGEVTATFSDSVSSYRVSRAVHAAAIQAGSVLAKHAYSPGLSEDRTFSLRIQADGRLVLSGYSAHATTGNDFTSVRLTPDGNLDPSFGVAGAARFSLSPRDDRALASALDSSDQLVLGGYAHISNYDFAIARLTPLGTPDLTFAGAGYATLAIGTQNDFGTSVVVSTDDKVTLSGYSQARSTFRLSSARWNPNGTLDTSFASSGVLVASFGSGSTYAYASALQPDHKLLIAGQASDRTPDFLVVRYLSSGELDASFGAKLVDFAAATDYAYAIAPTNAGLVTVAGTSLSGGTQRAAVARLTSAGELDIAFAGSGKRVLTLGTASEIRSLTVQQDQKLLLAGQLTDLTGTDFLVVRLLSNGNFDLSFANQGILRLPIGPSTDRAYSLALEANGNILVAGDTLNAAGNYDFALARLFP